MPYIDGFVAAVPNANRQTYLKHAKDTSAIFHEYGATGTTECWGDDVPEGEVTSFSLAVKRKEDESILFSWITWPSKEVRDVAWPKVMEDPRMQAEEMPFDGKRMIFGGFDVVLET